MAPTSIYPGTNLADLGAGAQLSLYGFRACAVGSVKCCCVVKTYNEVFGNYGGGRVLGHMLQFARDLGQASGRRLKLSAPGCLHFTHDETSVLGAVAAAQGQDKGLRDAHLTWLLSRPPQSELGDIVDAVGEAFLERDLPICLPEARRAQPAAGRAGRLECVGNA